MSRSDKDEKNSEPDWHVVDGGRADLERKLLWLIALGGDANRIEELMRTLEPAANHGLWLVEEPNRTMPASDAPIE